MPVPALVPAFGAGAEDVPEEGGLSVPVLLLGVLADPVVVGPEPSDSVTGGEEASVPVEEVAPEALCPAGAVVGAAAVETTAARATPCDAARRARCGRAGGGLSGGAAVISVAAVRVTGASTSATGARTGARLE